MEPMSISDLIKKVGDENVKVQALDGCFISANYKKGVTHVTFGTDAPLSPDGTMEMGIIVWLPRDKVESVLELENKDK